MIVSVQWLFLAVPCVDLQCVIAVFAGHVSFFFGGFELWTFPLSVLLHCSCLRPLRGVFRRVQNFTCFTSFFSNGFRNIWEPVYTRVTFGLLFLTIFNKNDDYFILYFSRAFLKIYAMAEKSSGIPVKRRSTSCINPSTGETKSELESKYSDNLSHQSTDLKCEDKTFVSRDCGINGGKEERLKEVETTANMCTGNVEMSSLDSGQTVLYYIVLIFMTVLGLGTRLYKIEVPPWIWYGQFLRSIMDIRIQGFLCAHIWMFSVFLKQIWWAQFCVFLICILQWFNPQIWINMLVNYPGPASQSVASQNADPVVVSWSGPSTMHTSVEIDQEMFSSVLLILLYIANFYADGILPKTITRTRSQWGAIANPHAKVFEHPIPTPRFSTLKSYP